MSPSLHARRVSPAPRRPLCFPPPTSRCSRACRTTDLSALPKCQHMLLYLNKATWTSGERVSSSLARDAHLAKHFGVHLLLAHEQPNVADQHSHAPHPAQETAQLGVPFDAFFNNPAGTTPTRLVVKGIYDEIAVPLKGGPFRPVSMALLAKAVITKPVDVALLHNICSDDIGDLDEAFETVQEILSQWTPSAPRRAPMRRLSLVPTNTNTKPRRRSLGPMEEFGVPHNPVPPGLCSVTRSGCDSLRWAHLQDDVLIKQREVLSRMGTPAHVRFARRLAERLTPRASAGDEREP